jgi:hypothetical protein
LTLSISQSVGILRVDERPIKERGMGMVKVIRPGYMVAPYFHRFFTDRHLSNSMAVNNPFRTILIAPCGMDCAICVAFLREKNRCGGCRSPDRKCHKNCTISGCDKVLGKYHHDCTEFPCKSLRQLDLRYRKNYGMSMIENLEAIRQHGIRKFIKSEKERWTCSKCGGVICVHRGFCWTCGERKE